MKFEVIKTQSRQQGIKYSLTLHDKSNNRILGFDNGHEIKYGAKKEVSPERTFDHWHYDENDRGRPQHKIVGLVVIGRGVELLNHQV